MIDLVHTDCLKYLHENEAKFDFCFADPPFNIDHGYVGFDDNMSDAEYQQFMTDWIEAVWFALKPGAAFVIHGSVKIQPFVWTSLVDSDLIAYYETQTAWHYRFGVCNSNNWTDAHCPQIVLRKPGARSLPRKWYPDNVRVPSDRATKYKDKRINDYETGGTRVPLSVFGVPSDGTHWGRVQGGNKERRKMHPNQLPIKLVGRHVLAYTQPGDHVLDPFCGSGTTALVCKALGRKCTTTDVSLPNIGSATVRVKEHLDLAKERLS